MRLTFRSQIFRFRVWGFRGLAVTKGLELGIAVQLPSNLCLLRLRCVPSPGTVMAICGGSDDCFAGVHVIVVAVAVGFLFLHPRRRVLTFDVEGLLGPGVNASVLKGREGGRGGGLGPRLCCGILL